MGHVMKKHFLDKDPKQDLFGFLPKMALFSRGGMGCLMGSSFCERVNSAGNQVVVAGNTMLSDDYIKKLVVLRMNREFMKFMRREYTLNLHQFEKFGSVARARDQKEDDPVVMPAVDVMCA